VRSLPGGAVPGCFVIDGDVGLGRAVSVAGFVPAELGVGTGLQAEQFGAHEATGMARQAVQRGADQAQAIFVKAERGGKLVMSPRIFAPRTGQEPSRQAEACEAS
jgi:hypothetical protein